MGLVVALGMRRLVAWEELGELRKRLRFMIPCLTSSHYVSNSFTLALTT